MTNKTLLTCTCLCILLSSTTSLSTIPKRPANKIPERNHHHIIQKGSLFFFFFFDKLSKKVHLKQYRRCIKSVLLNLHREKSYQHRKPQDTAMQGSPTPRLQPLKLTTLRDLTALQQN